MYLIISLCCVNLVLVMPTPSVAVSPSVRVPSQDAGRNTSGKMVTRQQNWFDLGGAGELHMGLDQLEEAGRFGIAMPSLQKQSKFPLIKMALYQHLSIFISMYSALVI